MILIVVLGGISLFYQLRDQTSGLAPRPGRGSSDGFDPYGLLFDPVTLRERGDITEIARADFPGWTVGEVVTDTYDAGTIEKRYIVWMKPPGRDFTVGVVYNRESDEDIIREDEVLAEKSAGHYLADEFLDVIEKAYVEKDATQIIGSSYDAGIASVEWTKPDGGFGGRTSSGFDQLEYNPAKKEWSIQRDSEWK